MAGPTIVAKFVADTSALVNEVGKVQQTAGSRLKSFAGKAGLAIGGAFAVAKIAEFGKASVDAASADAQAQAALAQTMRNVTGATDDQIASTESFLSGLSKATAIADDDLRPAMANLVRGFGDAGKAQDALSLATDISAGTGKDLVSVTEAMMKAANGNVGALGRLGIATKDSSGNAKTLDQIMGDMSRTFDGQAAKAADTTAGKMANASIQFGEFQETLGTAVLPAVGAFAQVLTNDLLPVLSTMAQFIADNSGWLIPLAGIILGIVGALKAWAAIQAVLNAVMAANPIVLVMLAIAALVAGIIIAYQKVDWFRDLCNTAFRAVATAFGWITDAAKAVFDWLASNWPLLLAIITGPIGLAVLAVVRNFDTIKDAATAVWQWIVDKFNAVADFLSGFVSRVGGIVSSIANAIKGPINAVIRGWNSIGFTVPTITLPKVDLGPFGTIGGGTFGGQHFSFPDIPQLAKGGIITSPTLAMIGEAGPEAVIPLGRGTGNRTYNLNVNLPVGGDPAMAGRAIVAAIRSYERANGVSWRA